MKGNKFIIGGVGLIAVGALAYFLIKKFGKGSKKDFILAQYDSKGNLSTDEKKKINDALDKMGEEEVQTIYDLLKAFADKINLTDELVKKSEWFST
jgi:hypothetical protein